MDAVLENYKLHEVDRVLELVKNLAACDDDLASKAIRDADAYLSDIESKKGFSRTIVNNSKPNVPAGENTDVTAFMSAVEKDAAERAERRNKQRVRAEKLKSKANIFFKAGDWQRAVELYTQAIDLSKDWEILYTNRAQANLRLGDAAAALADCDAAIFLLDRQQRHTDTQSDGVACRVEGPVEPDAGLAKAHLHRGKALVALGRSSEGLQAYGQSRAYAPTEIRRPAGNDDAPWPGYLAGYVAQAEAAVAAQLAEVKAQQLFDETAVRTAGSITGCEAGDSTRRQGEKTSSQLVSLLARLARGNQPVAYYVAGFRQLTGLFEMAPKTVVEQTMSEVAAPSADYPVTPPPSSRTSHRTSQRGRQHNRQKRGSRRKQNNLNRPVVLATTPVIGEKPETDETLECLQTLFRMKKGFSLLSREVKVVWSSFEPYQKVPSCSSPVDSSSINGTRASDHKGSVHWGSDQQQMVVNTTDRLLVLLHLANYLADACPENQRILVENHGNLLSLAFKCLLMEPGLVSWIIAHMGVDDSSPTIDYKSSRLESHDDARVQHKAESLRLSASVLVASLTSHASGRQALLTRFGPSVLLDAVAKCLADSLSSNAAGQFVALISRLQQQRDSTGAAATQPLVVPGLQPAPRRANSTVITATAVCCAAQITKVLEHVTGCPSFLLSARSSTSSLESLVAVIEAAVSAAATTDSSSTSTNTSCLASLLDSLAAACHDSRLRVSLLQRRQPLLRALAHCLQRHAGLFTDANHARLVGSICRLLHNIFVGDYSGQQTAAAMDDSYLAGSLLTIREALLTGVGTVLDQPGIGPEIRAVAVALAGRLLPLCSADQVLHWLGNTQTTHNQTAIPPSPKPGNDSDRCQLLLTILDSCSISVTANLKTADATNDYHDSQPVNGAGSGDTAGAGQLSSHLLGGCVRCLAAGSMHSLALRYAIGDDRRRVRRLARLLRVRVSKSAVAKSTTVRDDALAGNVCLILQHCCEDTPLAEHLQATSVIYDLLSLIQESNRLDSKRNAAILVGKLAHSSHVHRNELSRLDGWSVLTPFNSWSTRLGLA